MLARRLLKEEEELKKKQQDLDSKKLKPRFEKFKILIYNLNKYIILFSDEKLIIFSSEMLDVVQTIRNFSADIITITTSSKYGYIFVFTNANEVIVYAPVLGVCLKDQQGQEGKICWKKIHSQNLKFEAIDGYSSFDDQYLMTCGKNLINILELESEEEGKVSNFKLVFSLETDKDIKNVKFSTDSRSFAIRSAQSHNIYVYDFVHILNQDKGIYNLEDGKQVSFHELSHNERIVTFKFRDSIKHQNINQCPNTLISLDVKNTLRIWQESLIFNNWESNEENNKTTFTDKFYLLHSLQITFPIRDIMERSSNDIYDKPNVTCSFVYFNSDLSKADIQHDYMKNTEKRQYGNYEQDPYYSVDYISVFQENTQLRIYKVTGLRNYGKTSQISLYFTIDSAQFLNNIERISYLLQKKDGNNEYIEVFGWDGLNNLVKAVQNLNKKDSNNEKELKITYSEKYIYGQIQHSAFDTLHDNICIFTRDHQIRIQRNSPSQQIIPTHHRGLFRSMEQFKVKHQLSDDIENNIKKIYFNNNIIYIFPNCLSFFEYIQVQDDKNGQKVIRNERFSLEKMFQMLLGTPYMRRKEYPLDFELHDLKFHFNPETHIQEFYFALKVGKKIVIFKIELDLNQPKEEEEEQEENSQEKLEENEFQTQQQQEQQQQKERKKQQESIKFEFINEYRLYSDFQISRFYGFNVDTKAVNYMASNEKSVSIFALKDNQYDVIRNLNKEDDIVTDIGYVNIFPSLIYVITKENEIHMHKENGELLCKFILKQFLAFVDKSLYDIVNVRMFLKHLYDKNFILGIENYFLIVNLVYDQKTQQHIFNIVKLSNMHNQVYCKRVSRFCDPTSFEIYLTKNKNIILKTSDKIKFINSKFDDSILSMDQIDLQSLSPSDFLPENIHSKILQSVKSIPHHHPEFLFELLSLGNFEGVQIILEKISHTLKKFGKISKKYTLNLELLSDLFHPVQDTQQETQQTSNMDNSNQSGSSIDNEEVKHLRRLAKRPSFSQSENLLPKEFVKEFFIDNEEKLDNLELLIKVCDEQPQALGLNNMDIRKMRQIISFMQFYTENQRGLDIYASQFLFHVNMMQQQRMKMKMNQQSLMTKEIAWAIHSLQKETIIQETVDKTIQNQGESALNWNLLKKYCVVLWYDNIPQIQKYLESIAKSDYSKNKEPGRVALWYILIGQIKVLAFLYRTSASPNAKKMYELLSRNFNEERWASAACKNGMVLLQRKDYELSAFFLLLAGKIEDAVTVLIDKMKDIQLGILAALLMDKDPNRPHFKRIIDTHFIGAGKIANDPFLSHIGYYLLGQHINSINTLYEFDYSLHSALEFKDGNKKVCQDWPSKFEPNLSSFHPCAITLAERVKDTTQVKREIQEAENKSRKVQTMAQEFNWDDFGSDNDDNGGNDNNDEDVPKILENKQVHFELSIDYYLNINIPLLGLTFFKNYDVEQNEETINLQEKLLYKHLEFMLEEAILDEDYQNFFYNYNTELQRFKSFFGKSLELKDIQKMSQEKIMVLNSSKLSISINLAYDKLETSFEILEKIAREVQNQIYIYCCDNQIKFIRQGFWINLVYGLQEIDSGMKFIETYLAQNKQQLNQANKEKLKLIYFVRLSCELILDLGLEKFENIFHTLNKVSQFTSQTEIKFLEPIPEENYRNYLDKIQKINKNKQKNNKAHKYQDLYKDAFPTSPYDIRNFVDLSYNGTQNIEENNSLLKANCENDPEKTQLMKSVFKYLAIKKFLIYFRQINFKTEQQQKEEDEEIKEKEKDKDYQTKDIFAQQKSQNSSPLKKQSSQQQQPSQGQKRHKTLKFFPQLLNDKNMFHILMQYKKMQKKIMIRLIKTFRNYEQLQIMQELIDVIFVDEKGYEETNHFDFLNNLIEPSILVKIANLINFPSLFNKIKMGMHVDILQNLKNRLQNEKIEQEKINLIKDGIEIYKLNKLETFKSFSIKTFKNQFTRCTLISNKGFRNFEVINNLLNKTRSQDGCTLLEESSQMNYQQGNNRMKLTEQNPYLYQKQLMAQNKQPYSVNIAAKLLSSDQYHLVAAAQHALKNEDYLTFQEFGYSDILTYKEKDVEQLYKYASLKSDVDYSDIQAVIQHPNLPLIYTAGSKGGIDIWGAKNELDVLNNNTQASTIVGELNFNTNGSNEYIEKLKFNSHGDKLGGISNLGNFYMWKMSKLYKKPIFQILNQKLTDFCFLNEGSVFAGVSAKNFFIYDTLLPGEGSRLVCENFGGNAVYFMNNKYHILIVNYKRNHITVFDVQRNSVYKNVDLSTNQQNQFNNNALNSTIKQSSASSSGNIISSLLSSSESGLCLGYDNDLIKIYETSDFRLVNEVRPFQKSSGDIKKAASVVQLLESQNALFAASDSGVIVLAYLSMN